MDRLINKFLRFFRKKKNGPIHTWYPEILHWKQGDKINCWNIALASNNEIDLGDIQKFRDPKLGSLVGDFIYKSVDKNGVIYLEDEDDNLWQFEFWRFIKYAKNKSFNNRKVEKKLKESEKYMELLDNFQQSFQELQKADEKNKLLPKQKDN